MEEASRYKWFVAGLYVLALFMNLLDRDSSGKLWVEWLTSDDGFEGRQQRHALLSEGGKVATQAGKRVRSTV